VAYALPLVNTDHRTPLEEGGSMSAPQRNMFQKALVTANPAGAAAVGLARQDFRVRTQDSVGIFVRELLPRYESFAVRGKLHRQDLRADLYLPVIL
jgi:hypothetical protein